jgi:PAS domain S-box-containing protein
VNSPDVTKELRLRKKLIFLFLFFSLVPLTAVGIGAYLVGKSLIYEAVVSHLKNIAHAKSTIVRSFLDERLSDLRFLADLVSEKEVKGDESVLKEMRGVMARYGVYKRLEVIDKSLNVTNAVGPESVAGDCKYRGSFVEEALLGKERRGDVFLWREANEPVIAMSVPVKEAPARVEKAVVGYVSFSQIGALLRGFEVGKTGEAYLIDREGRFLTQTRLGGRLLEDRIPDRSKSVYLSAPGVGEYTDYRGKIVLGASEPMPGTNWILVAEQDSEEAFAEVQSFGVIVFLIWCIVLVLAAVTTSAISTSISGRLRNRYKQIVELKAYSDSIVATLPMAVAVLDKELVVLSANRMFLQAFNVDVKETEGRALGNMLQNERLLEGLRRTAQTGAVFHEETLEFETNGNETRYFNAKASPLQMGDRTLLLLVMNDVTEQKQTQEQIQKADRLSSLGILTAGVAHELNTPLANILLYSQMALEEVAEEKKELADNLRAVVEEAKRGATIVKELLEFSRQSDLEAEIADINEILANLISLVKNQCALSKIEIKKDFDPALPRIRIDLGRIQQVFMNIVSNAMWAMPRGGTLTVRTNYDGERQVIKVDIADTGIGIPKENLDRIFDPFFTTKRPGEGTGLGLSVSLGVVKKMGGEILVKSRIEAEKSEKPDQHTGSTFIVVLPVEEKKTAS